jgi:flagellar hook-length control protein FliK
MIQRLHLEEAQQPSAYAISAARESGEYKDDKENESLALEFQSLLAQISGQIAAIPDQAMAVGLALAQTAAPEHQKRDKETEARDDSGEQRDLFFEQNSQSRQSSVGTGSRQAEVKDQERDDDSDKTEVRGQANQGQGDDVLAENTTEVVCVQEEVIEGVEQQIMQAVTETVDSDTGQDQSIEQVIQGPLKDNDEQQQITTLDASRDGQVEQVEMAVKDQTQSDLKIARAVVKQEKQEESSEEEALAQSLASIAENAERDNENALKAKKNGHLDGKHRDQSEELHGSHKTDQTNSSSDSSARNHSQKHNLDRRRELQDLELGAHAQRLGDNSGKGAKATKEDRSGEFVETVGAPVTRALDRPTDSNSFQMTILRQSFDALRMNRADDKVTRPQSTGVSATGASAEAKATQNDQSSRASKGLTRPQTAKMLERVEATLKEAARSRDGRTISLHLEPVNLGKVKVDVSLREGVLHARIAPENQQVMTALREHAHELQSSLRKLGLDVESVSVSVTSDSFEGEMNTGQQMSDGRSFQDERNKMPRERAQLAENTVGNELAQSTTASAAARGSATRNELDHWVA